MSEAQDPDAISRGAVGVEDVRALMGASTPHFALQIRNRIERLISALPAGDPARIEGEREIARLEALGFAGEQRGHRAESGLAPLASVSDPAFRS